MTVLATERLVLRPIALSDFEGLAAFVAGPRARFVGGPARDRDAAWRAFAHLAGMWHLRGYGPFALALEGRTVGMAGPWRPLTIPEPEMSYTVWSERDEGRGLVTEAVRVLLRWSWEELRLPSLVSYIDPANERSVAVARRCGAVLDRAAEPSEPGVAVYRHPAPAHRPEAARCAAAG